MIHEEICTYKVCKLAKKKGFNEECREFYCDDKLQKRITRISCNRHVTSFDYCSNSMLEDYYPPYEYCYIAAPTQSLLQRWLREEKKYAISVFWDMLSKDYRYEIVKTIGVLEIQVGEKYNYSNPKGFDTYELALEDAELYVLKNLL